MASLPPSAAGHYTGIGRTVRAWAAADKANLDRWVASLPLSPPREQAVIAQQKRAVVAGSESEAAEKCRWLKTNYRCPVLIEEFLSGAEVTVGIAGNGIGAHVIGMMEIAPAEEDGAFIIRWRPSGIGDGVSATTCHRG